ncbi:hypothetical protein FAI40_01515 [Acetobacteraceae bacterium]|nr:hypothetical protein FAI40_01515 [Acetobacteraceae bacterium]
MSPFEDLSENQKKNPQSKAGLRFMTRQLEALAKDWAKLANYASAFNYYPLSLTEPEILEMAENLSAAVEVAYDLLDEMDDSNPSDFERIDSLMHLALYAEYSIQPMRKTEIFQSLEPATDLFEEFSAESAEDVFINELTELTSGEEM